MNSNIYFPYNLKNISTSMYVALNMVNYPLTYNRIKFSLVKEKYVLPNALSENRKSIDRIVFKMTELQMGGIPTNDPNLKVTNCRWESTSSSDIPVLYLEAQIVDYFDFLAFNRSLDENEAVLRKSFSPFSHDNKLTKDVSAGIFGISLLVIIKKEKKAIFTKRSKTTAVVPGKYHVSVAEGMAPHRGDINPFDTAVRGAWEELGIKVKKEKVKFLQLLYNKSTWQYELVGFYVFDEDEELTSHKLLNEIVMKSEDGQSENDKFFAVAIPTEANDIEIDVILDFFKETNPNGLTWSPHAASCLFSYLEYVYGDKDKEKLLYKIIKYFPDLFEIKSAKQLFITEINKKLTDQREKMGKT